MRYIIFIWVLDICFWLWWVKFNYILKNQDRVKIVTNDKSLGPTEEWIESAKTSGAKRKIKERIKRNTYN